ncbi:MAG: hypothetical protein JSU92_00685 [Deltaproteobacteria bacterium]|nr:MAG: hypothetical protein JSU92_00685 [Deltaproteobacteria bacterium]
MRLNINIKDIFSENIQIKVLSLILALIMWLLLMGEKKAEMGVRVPLNLSDLPPSTIITKGVVNEINVRVGGPQNLLRQILKENISIDIPLSKLKIGSSDFQILPEMIPLPRGVKVIGISPAAFTIELEPTIKKTVSVEVAILGEPAKGYKVSDISMIPPNVTLEGAKSELKELKEVSTVAVDISGMKDILEREIPLDLSSLHLSMIESSQVKVKIDIVERFIKKELSKIPVEILNTSRKYRLEPETIDLTIMGPENFLENFPMNELQIYIDLGGLGPGRYRRRATIKIPEKVSLLNCRPSWFEVRIR